MVEFSIDKESLGFKITDRANQIYEEGDVEKARQMHTVGRNLIESSREKEQNKFEDSLIHYG